MARSQGCGGCSPADLCDSWRKWEKKRKARRKEEYESLKKAGSVTANSAPLPTYILMGVEGESRATRV